MTVQPFSMCALTRFLSLSTSSSLSEASVASIMTCSLKLM